MDPIDYKILEILKKNAREKASNISKEIHLSVSSVIDRIHHMEKEGIIQGYTTLIDENSLGNDLTALIEVRLEHPQYTEDFVNFVNQIPYVVSCYYLTGNFDYLIKISCRCSKHLEQLHQIIKNHPGVDNTCTHFVLKTTKNIYHVLPKDST